MGSDSGKNWQCAVCGYIHRDDEAPDECPICGADKSDFELYEEAPVVAISAVTKSWRCLNCSYIHHGDAPPDKCPVCAAAKDRFEAIADDDDKSSTGSFKGHLVVVGAGIAGFSAVEAFRKVAKDAKVTLISKECDNPYYRLNLTRYLAGEIGLEELPIQAEKWFEDQNVDLKTGCEVTQIDPDKNKLELDNGESLSFDKLILAMGAHPFVPPISGSHREGFTVFRTAEQARSLKDSLKSGMNCVCIGGGLLGLEIAGALVRNNVNVTLLEAHDWLMPRQLNRRAAELLRDRVESMGIKIIYNARTKEIHGDERVAEVALEDGRAVACDLAVLCTGVRSNSYLARKIGLDVNRGIVVDNYLRTSQSNIYAVGDVAEHRGIQFGNWSAAQFQGTIAGMNAAGVETEFGGLPRSNTLKVLGLDMISIGQFEATDGSYQVLEYDNAGNYFRFVFHDNSLIGAILVGDTSISGQLKKAIQERLDFSGILMTPLKAIDFFEHLKNSK